MKVVQLFAFAAVVGGLLLLSATWNVEEAKRPVQQASTNGPYSAWARGKQSGEPIPSVQLTTVTREAIAAAADTPSFSLAPRAATSSAIVESATAAPSPPRSKPCAAGCEKHGVCNSELGRCDCPPFVGGADCSRPLIPACAAAVGLTTVAPAPCVYDQLSLNAPVSCECLMGCEALGLMGVRECYLMDASNRTVTDWVQHQIHVRGLAPNRDFWQSSLKMAHAESVSRCSGRGLWAPKMPNAGPARAGSRSRCWCYAGFTGERCEGSSSARPTHACLNSCSGRGACVRNWCHCTPGYYGVDCSLGAPAGGAPASVLPPPIGAQQQSASAGGGGGGAPRVYIYELPPRYNSWMHAGDGGWWQDFDLWGEDVIIHRRALRSAYRVTDPE